jgi:hypothetical protein
MEKNDLDIVRNKGNGLSKDDISVEQLATHKEDTIQFGFSGYSERVDCMGALDS